MEHVAHVQWFVKTTAELIECRRCHGLGIVRVELHRARCPRCSGSGYVRVQVVEQVTA